MSWGAFDSLMMAGVLKHVRACFEHDHAVEIKRAPGRVIHNYLILKSKE